MCDIIRIPNIENYNQEIVDGELILTPKTTFITEYELKTTPIQNSKIIECLITHNDEIISIKTKYRAVLIDIWKFMPTQKILQTTTFNFKLTNENGSKGYSWCEDIKMSFQSKDSNDSFREILHMCKVSNLTICISIKLESGKIVCYNTN